MRIPTLVQILPAPAIHAILVAVWTVEVFVVQELTLSQEVWVPGAASALRLLLDLAVCSALSLGLGRMGLVVVFLVQLGFFWVALTYHSFYHQPLGILDALRNLREGLVVAPFVLGGPGLLRMAPLYGMLLLKTLLAGSLPPPVRTRFAWGAGAYGLLLGAGVLFVQPLDGQAPDADPSVRGAYGYLLPNALGLGRGSDTRLLARAITAGAETPDGLATLPPVPLRDRLVIIQVESLDSTVLRHKVDGESVMPFLSDLANRSLSLRVVAPHLHGSADADFVALMGRMPSPDVNTYSIAGYPYIDALPQVLAELGFRSTALHGVSGDFYGRRRAFQAMGFDALVFREELEQRGLAPRGWAVPDGPLLQTSLELMRSAEGRTFHFLITVSTHVPFDAPPPTTVPPYGDRVGASGRFFDAMRYVDEELELYVRDLPRPTTLVVYGDHASPVRHPGYEPSIENGREYVPFLVHDLDGRDLSRWTPESARWVAQTDLRLVDAAHWLRRGALIEAPAGSARLPDVQSAR